MLNEKLKLFFSLHSFISEGPIAVALVFFLNSVFLTVGTAPKENRGSTPGVTAQLALAHLPLKV